MATNIIKTRIKHKNGTPDEWSQATNFSPLKGELVVYNDTTNPRMKIGDGETNVNDLPFINNAFVTVNLDGAGDGEDFIPDDNLVINAETLGGKPASSYMLKTDTATNSSNLGGISADQYALKSEIVNDAVMSINGVHPGEDGNVQLDAADVGARPESWMPTAAEVGALPSDGTAVNAEQLGGVAASEYALKGETGAVEEIKSLTADEFAALTTEEKAAMYASGVRLLAVDSDLDPDSMTDMQRFANFVYPVGSCYTTRANISPVNILGVGEWELVDKVFAPATMTDFFTANASIVSSIGSEYAHRSGHAIRILLTMANEVNLGDTTVLLGTIDFARLGIATIGSYINVIGTNDGGNGLSNTQLTVSGDLSHRDCVTKTSEGQITDGTMLYSFIIHLMPDQMLDDACGQFVWLRTM